MLHKTRGITLSYIRYRESSIIARVYTEDFGLQSYIINGVRSAKSKTNRIALFQPLTLLDMVVYYRDDRDLHRISEVKTPYPFQHIPFEVAKSSMALFMTEILSKTLKEESGNPQLFRFLLTSIVYLEEAADQYENLHLAFLLQLASYLGFGPESPQEFENQLRERSVPYMADEAMNDALTTMMSQPVDTPVRLTRTQRADLLDALVSYYRIHFDNLGEVKSLPVLREVLG
ncbi:DNA repair protein RecO [Fibrella forsythiae]|uniref:DNA repair protein RecO n=1 Tax=Fibrella forsythiae TaxID=2817061 RepID=A0ABS3JQE5_9BACT|nr:DNA repair protein RecO [Fibrella forsythiae]MBO0952230.1 DNA repair protein RecO [Fibrella forsythiae]